MANATPSYNTALGDWDRFHRLSHAFNATIRGATVRQPAGSGARRKDPALLLAIVSGSADRRDVLRCTWVGALSRSYGDVVRALFLVGTDANGQRPRDAASPDMHVVAVEEMRRLTRRRDGPTTERDGKYGGGLSKFAKTVAFFREVARQPAGGGGPLSASIVGMVDDDVYVVPGMLASYAQLLHRMALRSPHLLAGRFQVGRRPSNRSPWLRAAGLGCEPEASAASQRPRLRCRSHGLRAAP